MAASDQTSSGTPQTPNVVSPETVESVSDPKPLVGIVMGSKSDWPTMEHASNQLAEFSISHENRVVSAHRTPLWMYDYAKSAEERGIQIIIAGAGGAAHLPGMIASLSNLPVFGVPIRSQILNGVDSLLSIVQMPKGVPVGTFAIGESGARNAALMTIRVLANHDAKIKRQLNEFIESQSNQVMENNQI
jgi:5-(carboxyamino)imidazole ribonucleotide mutase